MQTIAYGSHALQTLDFYPAPTAGPHPLVVLIHGGGWMRGDKRGARAAATMLTRAGYAAASINYRLLPDTDGRSLAEDAASATACVLSRAAELGVRAAGFGLLGHSAGGQMAALLGTDDRYLQEAGVSSTALRAVIVLDGVLDLPSFLPRYPIEAAHALFGPTQVDWQIFSPVARAGSSCMHPLFGLMHADTNPRFARQAGLFADALHAHGETVAQAIAAGLTHGQFWQDASDPDGQVASFILRCLASAGMTPVQNTVQSVIRSAFPTR